MPFVFARLKAARPPRDRGGFGAGERQPTGGRDGSGGSGGAGFGNVFQVLLGDGFQLFFQRREQMVQRCALGFERLTQFDPE